MSNQSSDFTDVANLLANGVVTAGLTEVELKVGGSPAVGREFITVYNDSNSEVRYGLTGVTMTGSTRGTPIFKKQLVIIPASEASSIFVISGSVGSDLIVKEYGNV